MNDRHIADRHASDREADIVRVGSISTIVGEEVWAHVRSEFDHDIDLIMDTVALKDPLAYAVPADMSGSGALHLVTARTGVREHYEALYKMVAYRYWRASTEIKTPWYVFFDGIAENTLVSDGTPVPTQSAILFPVSEQKGILGEMLWSRVPDTEIPDAPIPGFDSMTSKRDINRTLFDRFLNGARQEDASAIAALFAPSADMIVRSYATGADEGCVKVSADGVEAFHRQLFDRFQIEELEPVNLIATEWYVFADLQWRVQERASGVRSSFRTAEIFGVGAPGHFRCRMGWGTAPIPERA